MKFKNSYFIIFGIIIFLGFAPAPASFYTTTKISPAILLFLSVTPLFAVGWRLKTSKYLRPQTTWLIISIIIIIGLSITKFMAIFSGAGGKLVIIQGAIITLIVAASVVYLTKKPYQGAIGLFIKSSISVCSLAAIWSTLSIIIVLTNAAVISNGNPYCIAHHTNENNPINSYAELRGFSFYTTASGYKTSSNWYFHGVMTVATATGDEYYNWSPRQQNFKKQNQENILIVPIKDTCTPQQKFWQSLTLF